MSEVTALDEKKMLTILDACYDRAINGIPHVSESVADLANNYTKKYGYTDKAISELVKYQVAKCGTSGFLTGLGGLITMPVAVPANVSSVLYVQIRMIAAIAYIRGYDTNDDEVRTFTYVCLTGTAMTDILRTSGVLVAEKMTIAMIKKIPRATITKINQKVGFKLVTKFGTKGVVNLTKVVPVIGGVIGGGIDIASTKTIAYNATKLFQNKDEI